MWKRKKQRKKEKKDQNIIFGSWVYKIWWDRYTSSNLLSIQCTEKVEACDQNFLLSERPHAIYQFILTSSKSSYFPIHLVDHLLSLKWLTKSCLHSLSTWPLWGQLTSFGLLFIIYWHFISVVLKCEVPYLLFPCFVGSSVASFRGKVKWKSLSHIWLFVTPWTGACQAPLSMEFCRQGYWRG